MKIVGIIPARMAASRFPGKPLAALRNHPMIEHVYKRAARATSLAAVNIATPDREIFDAAIGFGAPAIMTSATHARASDRVGEAARGLDADVFVNIQGDEPLVQPAALELLCDAIRADPAAACFNLVNRFSSDKDFLNRNQIKVVTDLDSRVLYMSREPIPFQPDTADVPLVRQLGIIAFRRDFLETFTRLPPTPLERAESIDMLRALEHGFPVRAVSCPYESFGIDTPEDLEIAARRLADDPLTAALFAERSMTRP
jgi:3-deoxy-manno-octulosonate cytidylyltransferase (CMP-KDO synthetase)